MLLMFFFLDLNSTYICIYIVPLNSNINYYLAEFTYIRYLGRYLEVCIMTYTAQEFIDINSMARQLYVLSRSGRLEASLGT